MTLGTEHFYITRHYLNDRRGDASLQKFITSYDSMILGILCSTFDVNYVIQQLILWWLWSSPPMAICWAIFLKVEVFLTRIITPVKNWPGSPPRNWWCLRGRLRVEWTSFAKIRWKINNFEYLLTVDGWSLTLRGRCLVTFCTENYQSNDAQLPVIMMMMMIKIK